MDRIDKIVIVLYTVVYILVIVIKILFEVSKCRTSILMSYFP